MKGDAINQRDEVLFRQIHPNCLHGGVPGSNVFRPTPTDQNKLSVDRSSVTDAQGAHAVYIAAGRLSVAVFGVTVGEFQALQLVCVEDQLDAEDGKPANLAHALVDYSRHSDNAQKNIAKRLVKSAIARGCLYQTTLPSSASQAFAPPGPSAPAPGASANN